VGFVKIDNIEGCDPYTYEAFEACVKKPAFGWTFDDIANGTLQEFLTEKGHDNIGLCVCSFALHLLDTSKLYSVCFQLASHCKFLLILSPHKKPEIKPNSGWELCFEIVEERIHSRLYRSQLD